LRDKTAGNAAGHRPLRPGEEFTTPSLDVTERMRADLVRLGGYTHPLFTRPPDDPGSLGRLLPGEAVLLLMGGLAEQSGRLDDAIVLTGLDDVRFFRPLVPGNRIAVAVRVLSLELASRGQAACRMRWQAVGGDGDIHAEVVVRMLLRTSVTGDDAGAS
jgi:3-hydroxymyristoyl/3-hydroxydecanoyl-(acyl carrier protein) dehydratase